MTAPLPRRLLAEFLGSAFLAALVIGSGIAAQNLSPDDTIDVGRMFSDTFAGIAPASVPGFVIAQLAGGVVAFGLIRTLYPDITPAVAEVVVPHEDGDRVPIA